MRIIVFGVHELKFIFHVKRDRIQVRIDRQKTIASFIV